MKPKQPITILHDGDLFRIYVDGELRIECFFDNKNVRPEEKDWDNLDPELQEKITNRIISAYGLGQLPEGAKGVPTIRGLLNEEADRDLGYVESDRITD